MPPQRRRYQLQADDVEPAKTWIEHQLIAKGALSGSPVTRFKRLGSGPGPLQTWCDRHLLPDQWRRLQATIRSRRRQGKTGVHVRLSSEAYHLLRVRADREGVTLSEAVLRLALAPPLPPPQVGMAQLVRYHDDMYAIECVGTSIGNVQRVSSGHWLAWLGQGEVRAEGSSAEKAADAVLRKGRVIVRLGREGESRGANPAGPSWGAP